MSNGWIKIHRKMLDNPVVMKDPDYLAVWMYLLLNATHKMYQTIYGGRKVTLHPGQLITGRKIIAEETGVNESKIVRIIKLLKSEHQIEQQANPYGSLITIVNWDKYQNDEQQNEQQVNNDRTTSEQQVNTIQEYKEYKEHKEERGGSPPPTLAQVSSLVSEEKLDMDPDTFMAYYQANDWTMSNGKRITGANWKWAVRLWAKREKPKDGGGGSRDKPVQPPKYPELKPEPKKDASPMPDDMRREWLQG